MNTSMDHSLKTLASFNKCLIILLFFSCCFTGLLRGQTSNISPLKEVVASIDLPDAYDPHSKMRKAEKESKGHTAAKRTLKLSNTAGSKLQFEISPNSCTQKLQINWEDASPTADFSLANSEGETLIPSLTISKGSRLEFDLPEGEYLILLYIRKDRYLQKMSIY